MNMLNNYKNFEQTTDEEVFNIVRELVIGLSP